MKKKFAILSLVLCYTFSASFSQSVDDIFNGIFGNSGNNNNQTNNTNRNNSNNNNLSNSDIVAGLKEALRIGSQNAGNKLSVQNGYFGNALVKIVMPPEAQKIENTLRSVGLGSVADKAILAMNRAAEDAAKQAAPIFINAITSMSIQDGMQILTGGNNAATNFLKSRTTAALTAAFSPVIKNSLDKVNAPQLWNTVFSTYNSLPLSQNKVNTDLTGYVTERALNGLFVTIAQEEQKIRTNPAAQVTSILQKVFGKR